MKIYTLSIEHRYGINQYAFATVEERDKRLVAFVDEWWENEMYDPRPKDDIEAIDQYFTEVDETYETGEHEIEIPGIRGLLEFARNQVTDDQTPTANDWDNLHAEVVHTLEKLL